MTIHTPLGVIRFIPNSNMASNMDPSPFRRVASAGKGLVKPTRKILRRLSLHDPPSQGSRSATATTNNAHQPPNTDNPVSVPTPGQGAVNLAWLGSKSSAEDITLAFSALAQRSASPEQNVIAPTQDRVTQQASSQATTAPTVEPAEDPPAYTPWSLRQSMRRLTPMRMSQDHRNRVESPSQSEDNRIIPGLASVSPQTNQILVTSLMSTVLSHSPSSGPAAAEPSPPQQQISRFTVTQTPVSLTGDYDSMTSPALTNPSPANETSRRAERQQGRAGRRRREERSQASGATERGNHERPSARRSRSNRDRSSRTNAGHSRENGRSSTSASRGTRRSHHRRRRSSESSLDPEEESRRHQVGLWQHKGSAFFASLACTVGLFNIDRFALLTVEYGGNFLIEFIILSFVFGIPLYCFQGCLGQYLGSGTIRMWRLSPIFKGVGISFLVAQIFLGLYTVVGVAWLFFYFRDAFISPDDRYRWQKCADGTHQCGAIISASNALKDNIPDYFNGRVLQRTPGTLGSPPMEFANLKFETAFNLAVIWLIVFVTLGKGIRSYGKVVYVFGIFPILGYLMVCFKILGLTSSYPAPVGDNGMLNQTAWTEFFTNSTAWVVAAREVFFTWALLGPVVMQITANNRYKHSLRRDTTAVILTTFLILVLSGFLASACIQILGASPRNFVYYASSYETQNFYKFLKTEQNTPIMSRQLLHTSYIMGVEIESRAASIPQSLVSGYNPLRFTTEIFPALISALGPNDLSSFWAVLFYLSVISFGIGQQIVLWYGVVNGIISFRSCCLKAWETTITFFTCAAGFLLSLPFATEMGITILYLVDYAFGTGWWLMILYVVQISAVLIVRGRPYSAENIVSVLVTGSGCLSNWCNPLLTFCWSIVLPIALVVLAISSFKTGDFSRVFVWTAEVGYKYWPTWARKMACAIQMVPLLLIPLAGLIQCFRYLCSGPTDLFERIKLLYRPNLGIQESDVESDDTLPRRTRTRAREERSRSPSPPSIVAPDPPPKYTPPPTYNTATGARIAKLLRESIRRSFRQIRDITHQTVTSIAELELGTRPRAPSDEYSDINTLTVNSVSHLPDYTSVEMENAPRGENTLTEENEAREERLVETDAQGGLNGSNFVRGTVNECEENTTDSSSSGASATLAMPLTAAEVTKLLRSSMRQSGKHFPTRGPVRIVEPQQEESVAAVEESNHVENEVWTTVREVNCDSVRQSEEAENEDNLVSVTLPPLISNAESFA